MEQIVKACVENGLGIASFIALLYFIFTYVKSLNETMTKISNTMSQMQINMATMKIELIRLKKK